MYIEQLAEKLALSQEHLEIVEDFSNRFKTAQVNEQLEVHGFWNTTSRLLSNYGNFKPLLPSGQLLAEIRTAHEPNRGERFLILLKEEQKQALGNILNDFTPVSITGRKKSAPSFSNGIEKLRSSFDVIEVDEIKYEDIAKFYEGNQFINSINLDRAANLLHEIFPETSLAEGVLINLVNTPLTETGRNASIVPFILGGLLEKRQQKQFLLKIREVISNALDLQGINRGLYSIGTSFDKKIVPNCDWSFEYVDNRFEGNDPILRAADVPIVVRNPEIRYGNSDDLNYLGLFPRLLLIFKSKKGHFNLTKFDKFYINSFNETVGNLPTKIRRSFLGLSLGDRIISADLRLGYGRKLDLSYLASKDDSLPKLDTPITYAEELILDAVKNNKLLDFDNQIYNDGLQIDKQGYGSMRKEITRLRDAITEEGEFSADKNKIRKLVQDGIIGQKEYYELERNGLIVHRIGGKLSLHPSLF